MNVNNLLMLFINSRLFEIQKELEAVNNSKKVDLTNLEIQLDKSIRDQEELSKQIEDME